MINPTATAALAAVLLLAACGQSAPPAGEESAAVPAASTIADDTPTPTATTQPVATTEPSRRADTTPDDTTPPSSTEPADSAPATEAPATDPPVTEPPPVPQAIVGGRALDAALAPAADIATNMLPDLVVDDVRRQAKVNLRNVFPADRPVLIWMWAPH